MKIKMKLIMVLLTFLFGGVAYGSITYDATYYLDNLQWARSGNPSLDPLYLSINEVSGLLGATAGTNTASKSLIVDSNRRLDQLRLTPTDTEPTSPTEGTFYADDSENTLKIYNGTSWVAVGSSAAGGSNTQIQYNDGGSAFGGIAGFIWDDTNLEIADDINLAFGTNADWLIQYDETVDDQLLFLTANTACAAITDPMFEIIVGATPTADQQVFGIAKGTQASNTALFTVDEDGDIVVTGSLTAGSWSITTFSTTGTTTLGNGTGTVAVDSSSWDISTAGAASGITTLGMSGDLTNSAGDVILASGKGIKSSTTTAHTVGVYGYDVDAAAYVGSLVVTNSNTPATVLGNTSGTTAISSSDWAVSITGAMTGIGAVTMDGALTVNNAVITLYSNEAIAIGHGTNGAADDLTIQVTGATDSSLHLLSAGTGEDAISVQSSAGGVDVDAAATKDLNLSGGQVALVSKENAASAISLTANVGTSETIVATNTQGTGAGAITLTATAGGIDIDAAAAKDIDIAGGQVLLSSKDNAASAIALTANSGTSETIVVTNTQGTATGALTLAATAGGIDIDCAAAKIIDIDGGTIQIDSKTAGAGAIALTANQGAADTITITNTQGTGAGALTLTATAGGITLTSNAGLATGDPITGDGTAALGGFLKTVTNDTDGKTLTVAESGTVQTNAGAIAAAAWTLPTAAAGYEYTFVVMAAQELRITPATGDAINIAGSQGAADEYWTANATGEACHLVAVDATNWIAISYTGTWTQQTP